MKYADLHIHSKYSDGTLEPCKIVEIAQNRNVKYISVTDHDSIAAQYILQKMSEDIEIITGIEISSEYNNKEIHILGYFIDIYNEKLIKCVNNLKKNRYERIYEIINKLQKLDIDISLNDLDERIEDGSYGRAHIANVLLKKGYGSSFRDVFTKYLVYGAPAYVKREKLDYKEALDIIVSSGGIPVLAHPGDISGFMGVENIIKDLRCYGLKGIEVYHPSHSKMQLNSLYNLSKKYKMLITGGSDCHGAVNIDETAIGKYGINEILLNKLINTNSKS